MVIFSPCLDCKNFNYEAKNNCCKSYPNGIPNHIFLDGSGKLCETINKNRVHFESIYEKSDSKEK